MPPPPDTFWTRPAARTSAIEEVPGTLSDHYDPRDRVLRLSSDIYHGRSATSVGIAAHESGHALQHATNYAPLLIRNAAVPAATFGGTAFLRSADRGNDHRRHGYGDWG